MENIIKDIKFLIIIFILLLVISIFLFIYYAYKVLKNKVELEKLKNALDIIVITDCIRRPHSDSQPINIRTLSRS